MAPRSILLLFALLLTGCSTLTSCDEKASALVEPVKINGQWVHLEIAADDQVRTLGLGGRDYIAPDGGMIFVFSRPLEMSFVMRDCPIPIDIAFLDAAGRVLAIHEMTPEKPRGPNETANEYESRLKPYPSRYSAQFAIELAGGRLKELGLKEGQRVEFDTFRLKRMAR